MAKTFSLHLLKSGLIGRQQYIEVLKTQKNEVATLDRVAVDYGFMTREQVGAVMEAAAAEKKPFGDAARESGLLSEETLGRLTHLQLQSSDYFREAVEPLGLLPRSTIDEEFEKFTADLRNGEGVAEDDNELEPGDEDTIHMKLLSLLADIAKKSFQKLGGISLDVSSFRIERKAIDNLGVIVFLEVGHGFDMMAFLSLDDRLAANVTSNMLRYYDVMDAIDQESMQLVLTSCLGELFNIICGQWQKELALIGRDISISPPRVEGIGGRSKVLFSQGHKAVYSRFSAPEGRGLIGYIEMAKENHV